MCIYKSSLPNRVLTSVRSRFVANYMGIQHRQVLFDNGHRTDVPKDGFQIVFAVGSRVKISCDSSDSGRYHDLHPLVL